MIHWNVDPNIIEFGALRVRWYGLMFVIGFSIGYKIIMKMAREEKKPTLPLENLLIYIVLGTTIGARLGHCLFYDPGYYLSHPLEIFKIWEGGLASHGGVIGVLTAILIFYRQHPEYSLIWLLDRISLPVPMIGAFIRFGNLMNSEIIGKPSDLPWAFVFERVDRIPRHPAQLYESLTYLCLFGVTKWTYEKFYHRKKNPPAGLLFGVCFFGIFTARFVLEFFKENQEPFEAGMALNMGQLLSLPLIALGLFMMIRSFRKQPKK